MKRVISIAALLAAVLLSAAGAPALAGEPTRMLGRILGERCAAEGHIGECYLKWAEPMVFLSDTGEVWHIELGAGGIRQERLDEAFGVEVELFGRLRRDSGRAQVEVARLNILAPPQSREFFKGCL